MNNQPMLTKVIATLGPAVDSLEKLGRLIDAGARVFRINFSHGTFEDYRRQLQMVREAADQRRLAVGVLGDLCGPKLRVGQVVEGGIDLPDGAMVAIVSRPVVAGQEPAGPDEPITIGCTYPALVRDVQPGEPVLLNDGRIEMVCHGRREEADGPALLCRVVHGGRLTSRKGINLPDSRLSVPSLTEYDQQCIAFAVAEGFDFLALSFVRSADDVVALKQRLRQLDARPGADRRGRFVPVIAKIEKPQALEQIEAIVDEADGVMVARGDLGVEMHLERVPVAQKRIIGLCHDYGKPVIVATQMLESMLESPTPTRAEVSDVANAIFDGADAVMLSGETAVGRWPVEAVAVMRRVAEQANDYMRALPADLKPPKKVPPGRHHAEALARGVGTIVRAMDARLVAAWFYDDGSVAYLSRNRMTRPILAFSSNAEALRRLTLSHGVLPMEMAPPSSTHEFITDVERILAARGLARPGDAVVYVLGEPITRAVAINNIIARRLGEADGLDER